MTKTFNVRAILLAFSFVLAAAMPFSFAYANPSSFAIGVTTNNAASTSPAYMTPGASTSTTPIYDAYAQTVSGGLTYKADFAGLLVQFTGSSTESVLNVCPEYSQDGIDWYRSFINDPFGVSTTSPLTITTPHCMTWTFASSTVGVTATSSDIATAALVLPTPFRFTRVVFSITGAAGAVWAQLVPVKQQR